MESDNMSHEMNGGHHHPTSEQQQRQQQQFADSHIITTHTPHSNEESASDASEGKYELENESDIRLPVPYLLIKKDEQEEGKLLSDAESILSSFFKCKHFPHSCHFYTNDVDEYRDHLIQDHPDVQLFDCFYCATKTERIDSHDGLVQHMLLHHLDTRFQCNLCLYRSSRDVHVLNHFIDCHFDAYEATTNSDTRESSTSTSATPQIKAAEHLMQTLAPPVKVVDTMTATTSSTCKILVCPMAAMGPLYSLDTIWFESSPKYKRVNHEKEEDFKKYQCAFCPFMHIHDHEIAAHCSEIHSQLPIFMYMPFKGNTNPIAGPLSIKQEKMIESMKTENSNNITCQTLPLPSSTPFSANHSSFNETTANFSHPPDEPIAGPSRTSALTAAPYPVRATIETMPCTDGDNNDEDAGGGDYDVPMDDDVDDEGTRAVGYITEEEIGRAKTDLEMSDDEVGDNDGRRKKKKKLKKKSRRQAFHEEEDDDDSDDDEDHRDAMRTSMNPEVLQRQRELRVEKKEQHSKSIQRIQINSVDDQKHNMSLKCVLCNEKLRPNKVSLHLQKHGTEYSFKCKDCESFLGSKAEVKIHIKNSHNGKGTIVKFIVNADEEEAAMIETVDILMSNVRDETSGSIRRQALVIDPIIPVIPRRRHTSGGGSLGQLAGNQLKRKRSTKNDSEKGFMMRKAREMTYIGPVGNDRTNRSSSISNNNNSNRTTHTITSSTITISTSNASTTSTTTATTTTSPSNRRESSH